MKNIKEIQIEEVIESYLNSSEFKREMSLHGIKIEPGKKEVSTFYGAKMVTPITARHGVILNIDGQEFHIKIQKQCSSN